MLAFRELLAMRPSLRLATWTALTVLLLTGPSHQQTWSACNPTQQSDCPADSALGKAVTIDFTQGASDSFTAQGNPTYGSDGVSFTITQGGDAPTLTSRWYIMFGRTEIRMKAAPGAGIVSSSVLQSDDLDEIDWEWLGAQNDQVQTNYFGKGQTTSYDRASTQAVSNSQGDFHTYTVDWTNDQIVWQIDGSTVRVLKATDANGQYPQTPMQIKIGAWAGGDPNTNAPGTVAWAQGPTDFSKGPFTMVVSSIAVTDYSTGTQYKYGDTSGSWTSIVSTGGSINGNADGSLSDVAAPAVTLSSGGSEPFQGTHADCPTCTAPGLGSWQISTQSSSVVATAYPGLPSGWTVSSSGKVIPPSSAPLVRVPITLVYLTTCSVIGVMFVKRRI